MKKIIYSLVIMIAAGSLFTACIDNVEPEGIYDLREAKADYLAALANLRAADAKVQEAQAALATAQAAVQQGIAAQEQAKAQYQALLNEKLAAENEAEKAKIEAEIIAIKEASQINSTTNAALLAAAKAQLAEALRDIEAKAMLLTDGEKLVILEVTAQYQAAMLAYEAAYQSWAALAATLYSGIYDLGNKDLWEAIYTAELEDAMADYEYWSNALDYLTSMDSEPAQWKAALDAYQAEIDSLNYEIIMLDEGSALAYTDARGAFEDLRAEAQDIVASVKDPSKETISVLVDIPTDNQLVTEAIYKLVFRIAEQQEEMFSSPYAFGDAAADFFVLDSNKGKMGFNNAPIEAVRAILFGGAMDEIIAPEHPFDAIGLNDVIETLQRDSVINNANYEELAADAAKFAFKADSVYKAHRAILEKGLGEFDSLKNALAQFSKDTAALHKALKDSADAAKAMQKDTNDIIEAVNEKLAGFNAATKEVYDNYVNITVGDFETKSITDTNEFVAAMRNLGAAQQELLGCQDSILVFKGFNQETGVPDSAWVLIGDIEKSGFVLQYTPWDNEYVHTVYGGRGFGWYFDADKDLDYNITNKSVYKVRSSGVAGFLAQDAIERVFHVILNQDIVRTRVYAYDWEHEAFDGVDGPTYENFLSDLKKKVVIGESKEDTVQWAQEVLKDDPAVNALKSDKEKLDKAKADIAKYRAAVRADIEAIIGAINLYYRIYDAFWGLQIGTHSLENENICPMPDSTKINWSEKTFTDPDKIILVGPGFDFVGNEGVEFDTTAFSEEFWVFAQDYDNIWTMLGDMVVYNQNEKLAAVLDALKDTRVDEAECYNDLVDSPRTSHIIFGQGDGRNRYTELVYKFFAEWIAEYYSHYTENQAALAAFAEGVEALNKAYEDAIADMEEAYEAFYEEIAEYTGETEDGEVDMDAWDAINFIAGPCDYGKFRDNYVNELGQIEGLGSGSFAEDSEELLGQYEQDEYDRDQAEWAMQGRINDLKQLIEALASTYDAALAMAAYQGAPMQGSGSAHSVFDANYEAVVGYVSNKVAQAAAAVMGAQKALQQLADDYDPFMIAAEDLTLQLMVLEEQLAVAETQLVAARAQYEAVIAKYTGAN